MKYLEYLWIQANYMLFSWSRYVQGHNSFKFLTDLDPHRYPNL